MFAMSRRWRWMALAIPYTASNSDNTRLIGQGPDNNELFTFEYHLTVTPDGTVTASFTNFGVTCQ